MRRRLPTNVTTTSSIEGWTIEAYLGPVAVHRVAGTGLISDVLAGWSDVFGGRSGAYRQQLESLYSEAIDDLTSAAAMRGGNWVVGFHADFDEISGQNKQMFMLVALGTAVRARRDTIEAADEPNAKITVSSLEVTAMVRERQLLEQVHEGKQLDVDAWDFLAERHNPGVVAQAVKLGAEPKPGEPAEVAPRRQAAARYLRALPYEVVSDSLFELLESDRSLTVQTLAILTEMRLGRLERARQMIASPNAHTRWAAVQALRAAPPAYRIEDIAVLEELRAALPNALILRPLVSRKKMFGEKQEWECVCGAWAAANEKCTTCWRDQRGIGPSDLTVEKADAILAARIDALRTIYGRSGTTQNG